MSSSDEEVVPSPQSYVEEKKSLKKSRCHSIEPTEDSKEDPTPGPSQEARPRKHKKYLKISPSIFGRCSSNELMLLARMIQFQDQARKLILKSH